MVNAASFGSLSKVSQQNDSESSFRNAYEEYRNSKLPKPKRTESPLTKTEKYNLNLLPSRNKTQDMTATTKILDHQYVFNDQPEDYQKIPGNLNNYIKVNNSSSQIMTCDEIEQQHSTIPNSCAIKRSSAMGGSYHCAKYTKGLSGLQVPSLPPLKSTNPNIKIQKEKPTESMENTQGYEQTLTGFSLTITKDDRHPKNEKTSKKLSHVESNHNRTKDLTSGASESETKTKSNFFVSSTQVPSQNLTDIKKGPKSKPRPKLSGQKIKYVKKQLKGNKIGREAPSERAHHKHTRRLQKNSLVNVK